MRVIATPIPGALVIEPRVFRDERGSFSESFRSDRYAELGIPGHLVQDNQSFSRRGVLRGLHIQHPFGQGKLVQVLLGEVFDVAVDLRRGSDTFGQWSGASLSGDNRHQFWVPPGFAHGYLVTSESALLVYKCSDYYHPEAELSLRWDDPAFGIDWPLDGTPTLSQKDKEAANLADIPPDRLPAIEDYP